MTVIQINVPFSMLRHRIDFVIKNRINPEIYFSGQDLDTCRENDVKHLAEALHENGLEVTIHGPFMDLSPGGVDPKVKEVTLGRFSKTMELARFLKPKALVFHPGYEKWNFDGNVALWLESSLETWGPLVKEAKTMGLVFAIENVYEETPDSLKSLLDEIHSPHFRFCFDTGHYHAFSKRKVPLSNWIETLGSYLWEVHLHDNHTENDEHLPMGEGSFDFDQFFTLLSQFQLKPIFTIEPHQEDHLWRGMEAAKRYMNKYQIPNAK
jgi:sugar phosphate isomerase/epimerase